MKDSTYEEKAYTCVEGNSTGVDKSSTCIERESTDKQEFSSDDELLFICVEENFTDVEE